MPKRALRKKSAASVSALTTIPLLKYQATEEGATTNFAEAVAIENDEEVISVEFLKDRIFPEARNGNSVTFSHEEKEALFKGLATISRNQAKIAKGMANLEEMLKFVMANMSVDSNGKKSSDKLKDIYKKDAIKSVEDLRKFEESLSNKDFWDAVFQYWTKKLGTDCGLGSGKSKAYYLLDEMFARILFTFFTWTGYSNSNEPKIALQEFKLTLNLFWEIVHNCDKTFTFEMNKALFQGIMYNSKVRATDKLQKKRSAPKNRPKKLKYARKLQKVPPVMEYKIEDEENIEVPDDFFDNQSEFLEI